MLISTVIVYSFCFDSLFLNNIDPFVYDGVILCVHSTWVDWGGAGGPHPTPPPLKNHKTIAFLSDTDPDHMKNHKATKPAFNAGPSSADDGPL